MSSSQTYEQNEWILHLAGKLLVNDPDATSLLAQNPFQGRHPPRYSPTHLPSFPKPSLVCT